MTRNPMCVTADTSAQDALNLMVSRGFRHLVKGETQIAWRLLFRSYFIPLLLLACVQ